MAEGETDHGGGGGAGARNLAGSRWATRATLLAFVALAGVPLALIWGRRELVYWRAAAAASQFDRGDRDGGLKQLGAIAGQFPDDAAIALALAQRQFEAGRFAEAAELAGQLRRDAAAAFESNLAAGTSLLESASLEARALTADGNRSQALARLKSAVEAIVLKVPKVEAGLVNHLAYQRALAGVEIDEGSAAMARLFEQLEQEPFGDITRLTVDNRTLVAATLLAGRSGRYREVAPLVDLQVDALHSVRELLETGLLEQQLDAAEEPPQTRDSSGPDPNASGKDELEALREANNWELAVLLAARAWAVERSGEPDAVERSGRDRQGVQGLGHEPDDILAAFPDERGCVEQIDQHAPLLDTWGLLLFREGRLDKAVNAINIAVVSAELVQGLVSRELGETPGNAIDPAESARRRVHSMAVQRIHRADCLVALGRDDEAAADREAVRAFGFDPADPKLF